MVFGLVIHYVVRTLLLIAQSCLVKEPDTAFPVASESISWHISLQVVLPACKIPHKIPEIHPIDLIIKEIGKVVAKQGHFIPRPRNAFSPALSIYLVKFYMFRRRAPHSGKEHFRIRIVRGSGRTWHLFILVSQFNIVITLNNFIRRGISLPVYKGIAAILLPAKISYQGEGVVRLIFVGGSIRRRPYYNYCKCGVPNNHHCETQHYGIQKDLSSFIGVVYKIE